MKTLQKTLVVNEELVKFLQEFTCDGDNVVGDPSSLQLCIDELKEAIVDVACAWTLLSHYDGENVRCKRVAGTMCFVLNKMEEFKQSLTFKTESDE